MVFAKSLEKILCQYTDEHGSHGFFSKKTDRVREFRAIRVQRALSPNFVKAVRETMGLFAKRTRRDYN